MKKMLFFAVFAFIAVSCQDDENTPVADPAAIDFTQLSKNELYGDGAENIAQGNLVINNTADWQELLEKMATVNELPYDFTETEIDFDQYTVIAAFDQVQPNGGHFIDVTAVMATPEAVVVTVENSDDGQGTATLVMNQPYHIVKIPKTTLPVLFE